MCSALEDETSSKRLRFAGGTGWSWKLDRDAAALSASCWYSDEASEERSRCLGFSRREGAAVNERCAEVEVEAATLFAGSARGYRGYREGIVCVEGAGPSRLEASELRLAVCSAVLGRSCRIEDEKWCGSCR